MTFDKIILNPPYNNGNRYISNIRDYLLPNASIVVLAPLSCFKTLDNYKYIKDIEVVDCKMFSDAYISSNLCIAHLIKKLNQLDWKQIELKTFDSRYIAFYEANSKLPLKYEIKRLEKANANQFNLDLDFIESCRLPDMSVSNKNHGYTIGNNLGFKINVLKDRTTNIPKDICCIHFYTVKEKENFCIWAYSDKNKSNLANELIFGLHRPIASPICSIAIPQIDWDSISDKEDWKNGNYDKVVYEEVLKSSYQKLNAVNQ